MTSPQIDIWLRPEIARLLPAAFDELSLWAAMHSPAGISRIQRMRQYIQSPLDSAGNGAHLVIPADVARDWLPIANDYLWNAGRTGTAGVAAISTLRDEVLRKVDAAPAPAPMPAPYVDPPADSYGASQQTNRVPTIAPAPTNVSASGNRESSPWPLAALVGVLALLLVGGGLVLALSDWSPFGGGGSESTTPGSSLVVVDATATTWIEATQSAQATATVISQPTRPLNATSVPRPLATLPPTATPEPTWTPVPTETPVPPPLPTDTPVPPPPPPTNTPVVVDSGPGDDLVVVYDRSLGEWRTEVDNRGWTEARPSENALRMGVWGGLQGTVYNAWTAGAWGDAMAVVQVRNTSEGNGASSACLTLRFDPNAGGYSFCLRTDGATYLARSSYSASSGWTIDYPLPVAVRGPVNQTRQWNELVIGGQENAFLVMVNGQVFDFLIDGTWRTGNVALSVENQDPSQPVEWEFRQLTVVEFQ